MWCISVKNLVEFATGKRSTVSKKIKVDVSNQSIRVTIYKQ